MAEAPLPPLGPIIVYVELSGPRGSQTVMMAMDTGALRTVIPIDAALTIGYNPTRARKRLELVTASGIEIVPQILVKAVRCLGQTVRGLEVVCHNLPAESPVMGLLGLDFLRNFNIHLNFLEHYLEIAPKQKEFSKKDLELMEKIYQQEKHTAKPVTKKWLRELTRSGRRQGRRRSFAGG